MPKETMTSCERIMKALAFKEPDRVPLDTRISDAEIVERTKNALGRDAGRYLEGDTLFIRFKDKTNDEVFRKYLGDLPEGAAIDNWGVGLVPQKGPKDRTLAPVEIRPLENVNALEQLKEYPFPDMTEDWRHSHLEEAVREGRARGKAVVGQMSQTILESSYRMRGIERLFVDFYANPDYVDCLFDLFTESRVFMAKRFAEAGVDILRIGDDIATQRSLLISPHMYRERLKERHREVIVAARKIKPDIPVLYHSDGNIREIIPDLIEIGVTALNPVQPESMNVAAIKKEFGDRITLWGTMSTQRTIAFGSREDVRSEVKLRMEAVGRGGGLVLNLINVALSDKARDNIVAFFEAVRDFCWY